MTAPRKFDLRKLEKRVDAVILRSGREVAVYEADAGTFDLYVEWSQDQTRIDLMQQMCRRVLPDATREELQALTIPMQLAVIRLACGQAEEVYGLLGESSGLGATSSQPSTPETPSAPSVSG